MNDIHGLAQYCSNSIANALELLQSYAKPKICYSLDLFTGIYMPVEVCKRTVIGVWKTVGIPTGHVSP